MIASIDIISLQINSNLHKWLQDEARHHNTTVNKLITEAIRGYYKDELGGDGLCPYGKEIIEKRAACDREDTDCAVCFKESHCKALAKAERELK